MGRYESDRDDSKVVQIKVVGVGGGGGNAVNRMVHCNIQDVEFVAVNSDKPALAKSTATHKILIGERAEKLLQTYLQAQKWYLSLPVWAVEQVPVQPL